MNLIRDLVGLHQHEAHDHHTRWPSLRNLPSRAQATDRVARQRKTRKWYEPPAGFWNCTCVHFNTTTINTLETTENEHAPLPQGVRPGDQQLTNTRRVATVPGHDVMGSHHQHVHKPKCSQLVDTKKFDSKINTLQFTRVLDRR